MMSRIYIIIDMSRSLPENSRSNETIDSNLDLEPLNCHNYTFHSVSTKLTPKSNQALVNY